MSEAAYLNRAPWVARQSEHWTCNASRTLPIGPDRIWDGPSALRGMLAISSTTAKRGCLAHDTNGDVRSAGRIQPVRVITTPAGSAGNNNVSCCAPLLDGTASREPRLPRRFTDFRHFSGDGPCFCRTEGAPITALFFYRRKNSRLRACSSPCQSRQTLRYTAPWSALRA